jgi:tRNA threonylcarbamoyladenosine modification (KEOPS) complex  Pcc1 subunit
MIHVVAPDVGELRASISSLLRAEGIVVGRMVVIEPSLEDVFIASMH